MLTKIRHGRSSAFQLPTHKVLPKLFRSQAIILMLVSILCCLSSGCATKDTTNLKRQTVSEWRKTYNSSGNKQSLQTKLLSTPPIQVSTQPPVTPQTPEEVLAKQIAQVAATNKAAEEARTALLALAAQASKAVAPQPKITARFQLMADEKAVEEFGEAFGTAFYVGEVSIENQEDKPFLAYGASLLTRVNYHLLPNDLVGENELDPELFLRLLTNGCASMRRPSTYADIISIFDYQKQSSTKQQIINYLKSAGEVAAGATVFVHGADYSKVVALITGVITPELEKRLLWDIILHSKNLESRSFKELEEIPAGSGITRVVFFPRGGITGIIDKHRVYISSFDFSQPVGISGSLITKDPKQAQP